MYTYGCCGLTENNKILQSKYPSTKKQINFLNKINNKYSYQKKKNTGVGCHFLLQGITIYVVI